MTCKFLGRQIRTVRRGVRGRTENSDGVRKRANAHSERVEALGKDGRMTNLRIQRCSKAQTRRDSHSKQDPVEALKLRR